MKKSLLSLTVATFAILGLSSCGGNNSSSSSTPAPSPSTSSTTPAPSPSTSSTTPAPSPSTDSSSASSSSSEVIYGANDIVVSGPAEHQSFVLNRLATLKAADTRFANVNFVYALIGEDKIDSAVTDWSNGPDVYAYASDKILSLNQKGAMAEVPTTFASQIEDTMGDGAYGAASLGGKLLAYPYAGDNGYFLYYDKSALTAEDIASWDSLFAAAATAGRKVGYPIGDTAFYSMGAMFTYGADYNITINDEGVVTNVTADFDGEKGIKAAKGILNIMQNKQWQNAQAAPTVANGVIASVNGGWAAAEYQKALGEDFGCAKMPTMTVDGDTQTTGSFLGYKLYGVNPQRAKGDSTHLALAHVVANYLVNEESQAARFEQLAVIPTNTVVANSAAVKASPVAAALADQGVYAHAQGAVPSGLWDAPTSFTAAITGGKVTEANIADYCKTLNDTLTKI